MNIKKTPSAPSIPYISKKLHNKYKTMQPLERKLFKSIYVKIWNFVFNVSKVHELATLYPLPYVLWDYSPRVSPSVFFMFSKIYTLTLGGAKTIDSRLMTFRAHERQLMQILNRLGFIGRGAFDPLRPSLRCVQHVFVWVTPAGIQFYNDIVKLIDHKTMQETRDNLE